MTLPSLGQNNAAILTGSVEDGAGSWVSGARIELQPENGSGIKAMTATNSLGHYYVTELLAGDYTLKVSMSGFTTLVVKSIHITDREQKAVPSLNLTVGYPCGLGAVAPGYVRILPSGTRVGSLFGSVFLDSGPVAGKRRSIAGVGVSLVCPNHTVCGYTKTDSKGSFTFREIAPGTFSLFFSGAGIYPRREFGYRVQAGLEGNWSFFVEQCPHGNCDPRLRPKKPIAICE